MKVNKKIALENIKQTAHKITKRKQDAEAIAAQISKLNIQIGAKAGERGKIFGAITSLQIAEALKAQIGYIADRRDISFEKPVKILGMHKAILKIHKEVIIPIQFEVITENSDSIIS